MMTNKFRMENKSPVVLNVEEVETPPNSLSKFSRANVWILWFLNTYLLELISLLSTSSINSTSSFYLIIVSITALISGL